MKSRNLKIGDYLAGRQTADMERTVLMPMLRLKGKWFLEAGFQPGEYVYVETGAGCMDVYNQENGERLLESGRDLRRIKISSYETKSRLSRSQYPMLVLKGAWMVEIGFKIHDEVVVDMVSGRLVIAHRPEESEVERPYQFEFPKYQRRLVMTSYNIYNQQEVDVVDKTSGFFIGQVEHVDGRFVARCTNGLNREFSTEELAMNHILAGLKQKTKKVQPEENPDQLGLF